MDPVLLSQRLEGFFVGSSYWYAEACASCGFQDAQGYYTSGPEGVAFDLLCKFCGYSYRASAPDHLPLEEIPLEEVFADGYFCITTHLDQIARPIPQGLTAEECLHLLREHPSPSVSAWVTMRGSDNAWHQIWLQGEPSTDQPINSLDHFRTPQWSVHWGNRRQKEDPVRAPSSTQSLALEGQLDLPLS